MGTEHRRIDTGLALADPVRLAALTRAGLMDTQADASFDRITTLVRHSLKVPVSLLSLVDDRRQFFKSALGLPDVRETPLSHSFCQHVVTTGQPLVVNAAENHPLVCDNLAIRDLDVKAYLGFPVYAPGDLPLGALCAIDTKPHEWTEDDQTMLRELAELATTEVALRIALRERADAQARLKALNADLESLVQERTRDADHQRLQSERLASALALAEQHERRRIARFLHDDVQQMLFGVRMKLHMVRKHETERQAPFAAQMDKLLEEAIASTHNLVPHLDPAALTHGTFLDALHWLAHHVRAQHGLRIAVTGHARLPELGVEMKSMLFQIVRELVFNVVKHAGTDEARLHLDATDEVLRVRIEDQGCGFDPDTVASTGYGLHSIHERLQLLEGALELISAPGEGTQVRIAVPF